ncbi:ARL14 effector protein-like isoform X3 [Narcine bancroftii]|uniref:ARL14 effector protein-like isoform X3 n=1 Tax=Narcine bancroftii TaxID=1343680 RepID=UPI0038316D03
MERERPPSCGSGSASRHNGGKRAPGALQPPGRKARTTKALRSLQFANPGRQITQFTPETSRREKRKLQTKQPSQSNADRYLVYSCSSS